jgi:hypothetical protein
VINEMSEETRENRKKAVEEKKIEAGERNE